MRIALLYDCLFPSTVGGAERWYRNLAEQLEAEHDVTYLTRRQWGAEGPETSFETIAVSPGGDLYSASGRRRIGSPLLFGWGVFRHLLRHAHRYDAVHTASFPYFSVIGAWAALRLRRSTIPLVVDWHEFWTDEYWRFYLGPLGGRIGSAVQTLCLRAASRSFTFSHLVEERIRERDYRRPLRRLTGEYSGPISMRGPNSTAPDPPFVVFAGRHIAEKHVLSIPSIVAAARREIPDLRCVILGDGPETSSLRSAVRDLGLSQAIEVRGRVGSEEVEETIASATCLLHPSEREGYGVVLVEAFSLGTPAVVVSGSENAAVELVDPGVNGFVAESRSPECIARLVVAAVREGDSLRLSTLDWYARNSNSLSLQHSLELVEATYRQDAGSQLP